MAEDFDVEAMLEAPYKKGVSSICFLFNRINDLQFLWSHTILYAGKLKHDLCLLICESTSSLVYKMLGFNMFMQF